MHTEPRDVDRAVIVDALRRHWGIAVERLDYAPVGFGTHHWIAVDAGGARWFVSGDDLHARQHAGRAPDDVFAALDRAFRTAAALRGEAGLEFVLAPIPSAGGAVTHRLDAPYAIRVEPFVAGTSGGEFESAGERRRVAALLGRLHAATEVVPDDLPGRDDLSLPGRAELETALADLDGRWDQGPFAERARALLQDHAGQLQNRMRAFDELAGRVRAAPGDWVVTHGEPHSANVIRDPAGGLLLVDWDTTLVAPRERDLWMVLDAGMTGRDEYREAAGAVPLNAEALRLYREWWSLAEICMYVAEFRRPHDDTADTRASWRELTGYL